MIELRDYQIDCLRAIEEAETRGVRRQLISAPTGSGKTVIFAALIAERTEWRTLVLANAIELLQQAKNKLHMIAPTISAGMVCGDEKNFEGQVVISSIQSAALPQNLDKLKEQGFDLIIIDEAHRGAADSYKNALEALEAGKEGGPLLLGFSGTCFRSDEKGLAEVFDEVVFEISISELIEAGYLVRPNGIKLLSDLDLNRVKVANGDYDAASLAQAMDTPEMVSAAVDAYQEHAEGVPAIAFACTIAHAEHLSEEFSRRGISSAAVSGQTPKAEREAILRDYSAGEIDVLCNCALLTEGVDLPRCSAVIIARPTKSRGLFAQMCGRALRLYPNKSEALILDFGEVDHSLVTPAELLEDEEQDEKEREEKARRKEILDRYPAELNQRVKTAAVQMDLFSESNGFAWSKDFKNRYYLKGPSDEMLRIEPTGATFAVRYLRGESVLEEYGAELDFSYAFSVATAVAAENRERFVIADLHAPWRDLPISEGQLNFLRKKRFKNGLDELTRGQASSLIASGALNRRERK